MMARGSEWPGCRSRRSASWPREPGSGRFATPLSSTPSTPCTNSAPDSLDKSLITREGGEPPARRPRCHHRSETRTALADVVIYDSRFDPLTGDPIW
jgi:hypothetical protein